VRYTAGVGRRRRDDRGGVFVFAERDDNPCDARLAVALGPDLWRQNVQASRGVARAIIDQRFAVDLAHDQTRVYAFGSGFAVIANPLGFE
jgi:hypothetical protein